MGDGGVITLRLAIAGQPEVKAVLASLGPDGARALKQIELAQVGPSNGMVALSRIFEGGRERVKEFAGETGTAGSALEAFGAGGLAAAAGIGAAVLAGEKLGEATHQAMEYGEALETAAVAAGVTTETLQKYRYAAEQSGIATMAADAALAKFTQSFGLAKEGSQRQLKFFDKLFTPEDLRGFQTVDEALDATVAKLADLPDVAERAAIAKRLGLAELTPLLMTNKEHIAALREEAVKLGVVMDEQTVKALAEAEKKFKSASDVINTQFKSAVVALTPILVTMIQKISDMVRGLDEFLNRFKGLEARSKESLLAEKAQLEADAPGASHWELNTHGGHSTSRVLVTNAAATINTHGGRGAPISSDAGRLADLAAINAQLAKIDADEKASAAAAKANLHSVGTDFTSDKTRKGPDEAKLAEERAKASDALIASAKEEILAATKKELEVQLQATTDIGRRAAIQTQISNLDAQEADAAADRKLVQAEHDRALKKISGEALAQERLAVEATKAANDQARDERNAEIARQAAIAKVNEVQALHATEQQSQLDSLRSQLALSTIMSARAALAVQIFDLEEQMLEDALKTKIASAELAQNKAEEARLSKELASAQATAADRRQAVVLANPSSPWEDWMNKAKVAVNDVHTAIDQMKVDGLDAFNQSLFDSEGRFNGLGNAAHAVFTRMLVDLEQYLLKQAEISLFGNMFGGGSGGGGGGSFLSSLFGGSGGGSGGISVVQGGLASVFGGFSGGGDIRGPGTGTSDSILIAASDGEKIMTAQANQMYGPLLDAMNAGKPLHIPHFAAGGTVGGRPSGTAGGGFWGGLTLNLTQQTAINAPGADSAALQRVENAHQDWQRGEPDRVMGYLRTLGILSR